MIGDMRVVVLRLVSDHDGQWGWLQIDRALAMRGILGVNVGAVLNNLVEGGFAVADGDVLLASTRYRLTDSGRRRLGVAI